MSMMSRLDARSSTEEPEAHIGISPGQSNMPPRDVAFLKAIIEEAVREVVHEEVESIRKSLHPINRALKHLEVGAGHLAKDKMIIEQIANSVNEKVESVLKDRAEERRALAESLEIGIIARSFQLECIEDELEERQKEIQRRIKDYKDDNKAAREVKEPRTMKEKLRIPVSYPAVGLVVLVLVGLLWWIGVGSSG
ncbi:hypothetical protein K449DRAFT_419159 [Hypoxylon sp. EC38]|nr:hypothetical protein K449DRAFT_419159 [Hypoxylon sp. EC38]